MENVWSEWKDRGKLDMLRSGDEMGHFIAEEASGKMAKAIVIDRIDLITQSKQSSRNPIPLLIPPPAPFFHGSSS